MPKDTPSYQELAKRVTELEEEVERRERAEERYRDLIDNINDVVFVGDKNGVITYISPAVKLLLGYEPWEIIGRPFVDFVHPNDTLRVTERLQLVLSGDALPLEIQFLTKSGELRWLAVYDGPFYKDNQVIGVLGILRDITERKIFMEELLLMKRIFESSHEAIAISDPYGRLIYINPAHEKLFGRSLEQAQSIKYTDYYPKESIEILTREIIPALENGESWEGELEMFDSNRRRFTVWERADSILDSEGKILYVFGLMHDVTERKRMENSLKKSEARYRAVVEDQTDLICRFLPDRTFTFVNEAFCRYFDIKSEELIGQSYMPYLLEKDREKDKKHLASLSRENPVGTIEHRIEIPDGKILWQQWTDQAIFDEQGQIVEFQSVGRDITERKQVEKALGESEKKLDSIIKAIPDIIYRLDPDGIIIFISDAATKYGYKTHELIGTHIHEIVHPDDREKAAFRINERRTGERSTKSFELRLLTKEKEDKLFEIRSKTFVKEPVFLVDAEGLYASGESPKNTFIGTQGICRDITDRKLAEEELREYKKAVESSEDLIVVMNREYVYILANEAFLRYHCLSREQVIGKTASEILGQEVFRTTIKPKLDRCLQEETIEYDMVYRYSDLGNRNLSVSYYPFKGMEEEITGVLAVIKDNTEKKRIEEALKRTEREKATVLDGMEDILTYYNKKDLKIQWANRAANESVGLSAEELVGRHCYELWTQAKKPCSDCPVLKAFETRKPQAYEKTTHDSRIWYIRANPVLDGNGKVEGVVEIAQNITERKQAEKALQESEKRYRKMVTAVTSYTYFVEVEGGKAVSTRHSPGCLTITGYTPEDHESDPNLWFSMIYPEDQKNVSQHLARVLAGDDVFPIEHRIIQRNGSVRWVRDTTVLFRNNSGEVIRYDGLVEDITERKQAEEQIRSSLREKEVLLREIHHRVKNNLQVISSLLDLQAGYLQDPQGLQVLRDSRNRVRVMALIHEKLYQSLDLARIDTAEYIQNVVDYLFQAYEGMSSTINLSVRVEDVSLAIESAIPCGLIINELVTNALKHAFPSGKEGEIRVELCKKDGGGLTLVVSDSGIGLPPDFDFQKPPSLGLRLVKMLTSQLMGTIELDRSSGTTFKITFEEGEASERSR
ncbi:MAG TPA: PAS domain S-box protein [archaeon]|nr:PAS domain S-box protein [archaeon]